MRGRAALALLIALAAAAPPPARVASLDLCADEYALLLAGAGQLVSVSRLGADRAETALAGRARGLHRNNGRFDSVAALTPDLVLTSGGGGRYAAELAARMGTRTIELPSPETPADVRRAITAVAAALGREAAGRRAVADFDAALGPVARARRSAALLRTGGLTAAPDGLAAAYLARAGLAQQRHPGDRLGIERLLVAPPQVLVRPLYRAGQVSRPAAWAAHPALARLPSRVVTVDGRGWTCLGPLAAATVPALRAAVAAPAAR